MDHRNRAAPIALAAQAPVAQAVFGDALAPAGLFREKSTVALMASSPVASVSPAKWLTQRTFSVFGGTKASAATGQWRHPAQRRCRDHRQIVFAAEIQVALVMRRAGKDRAGAVIHQDEVGDPNRQFPLRVQRMLDADAGIIAQLSRPFRWLPRWCRPCGTRRQTRQPRPSSASNVLGNRVIGRNADKGRAQQRVGAGGIDLNRFMRRPCARTRTASPRDLPIQFSCIRRTLAGQFSKPVQR